MAGIRARRKAERPAEILEAALEEFMQHGFTATRLEDVAARIGITKGTIYFYFGSKERVFEEAIQSVAALPLVTFQEQSAPWTDNIADDINAYVRRFYEFMANTPRIRETLRLCLAEANRFPDLAETYGRRFMGPVVEHLRQRLIDANAKGDLGPDLAYLPEIILSPALANSVMMMLYGERRVYDVPQILQTHRRLLRVGLQARTVLTIRPDANTPRELAWACWTRFPDPRQGEPLTAPIGPGLFEMRLEGGELLLLSSAHSVAIELASVLPIENAPRRRSPKTKLGFLQHHRDELEYRTLGCATVAAAQSAAKAIDRTPYRFRD